MIKTVNIYQVFKKMSCLKQLIIGSLIIIALLASLVTGTQAWSSLGQNALNMGQNKVTLKDVFLQKYALDGEGNVTTTPIQGASFYLYRIAESGNTQIGALYVTDKQGRIPVTLAPGEYYFEEVTPSFGYTFDHDEHGDIIKRYSFSIHEQTVVSEPIVVAYNRLKTGQLVIEKEVINHDESDLTAEQQGQEFEFMLTFSDGGSYYYQKNDGEPKLHHSGDSLSLKHGEKGIFKNIPQGVHYTVTETAVTNYQSQADNTSGNINEKVSDVHFINTFMAPENLAKVVISKEVVNGDQSDLTAEQKETLFEFELILSDELNSYPFTTNTGRQGVLVSGDKFELAHGEILTLTDIPAGINYEVIEKPLADYSASPNRYQGIVQQTDTVSLPFINQFKAADGESNELIFSKEVVAETIDQKQKFPFEVTFSDDQEYEYQINEGKTQVHQSGGILLLGHGDQVVFSKLPVGLTYQIKEHETEGYQSQLTEVSGTIISQELPQFIFHNFKIEQGKLVVEKKATGENFDLEKKFSFDVWINGEMLAEPLVIKAGQASAPLTLEMGDRWVVVERDYHEEGYEQVALTQGTGVMTTPNEEVTVTQTNSYTLPPQVTLTGKKSWSIPTGVTVDLPKSITVQLVADQQVVASREVSGPNWEYQFEVAKYDNQGENIAYSVQEVPLANFNPVYSKENLDIKNVYIAPVTSQALLVEKKVIGDQPSTEAEFEFRLSPTPQVITIEGSGTGSFSPLTFTQAGNYTYTITEKNNHVLGYTYDTNSYTWTIVIVLKENKLVIESERIRKAGVPQVTDQVIFTNQFTQERLLAEKIKITGEKTWQHGTNLTEKQPTRLTVLLFANDALLYQQEISAETKWQYEFNVNHYDENGREITYRIDEETVPNYEKTITGYDLTNKFIGQSEQDKPSIEKSEQPLSFFLPQTSLKNEKILSFIGLMVFLASIYQLFKRKNKKQRKVND